MKAPRPNVLFLLCFSIVLLLSCNDEDHSDGIGQVSFKVSDLMEVENATIPLSINVNIDNPEHGGGMLTIVVTGGTYGTDFETSGGAAEFTLDVKPNVLLSTFSISPVNDDLIENDLSLTVTITAASGNLQLGDETSFALTIIDDDKAPEPALVSFAVPQTSAFEGDGSTTVSLVFSEMLTADAEVEVVVDPVSTGEIGTDFNLNGQSNATIVIALLAGMTEASFEFNIVDDMEEEDVDNVVLRLMNPSSGILLAPSQTQTTISIIDNDGSAPPIDYLETFETNDGTSTYLNDVLGYENILINQSAIINSTISLIESVGNFSDEADPAVASDNGLNLFYNSAQDPTLFGNIDNIVISPEMIGVGVVTINVDLAYAFKSQNNATVTMYWSETYDGSGAFNESDWTAMGMETAELMDAEGFGNNIYKRAAYNITATQNFYVAIRVQQNIDDTYYRTRWRFDNLKVAN